ncbi:DUF7604 domain-containing protein [Laedolimicola sp.]|uniref:DUF7604 domain-containing protein n=1 Tax=Laedolimicola sp. TaxID=2981663 RepID=UPI003F7DC033
MKSKMLKRAIAIMLCMVIVMGGAEHMRAGSSEGTEETTTKTAEEEIVLSDDGDENPAADAEEGQPKEAGEEQPKETPSEEGQSESKAEEGQSESKAEEGQSGPKVEEGQPGAQNPDAGETKTGEGEENIPEEELKEKPIMELTYEDSQVSIRVTADEEGNIPQGASLSVTPIEKKEIHDDMDADAKAEAEELNAQYDATAEKLQEKAEGEEYDILGFLAYDITFVDENDDKLEPNGSVSVSMDYKEAAIPEEVKTAREAGAEVADVTLMHLEENSDGAVKDVVDMVADESQEANVQTTANTEVEKAEFATESFSVFTLTWKGWMSDYSLSVHVVDTAGNEIGNGVGNVTVSDKDAVSVNDVAKQLVVNGTFQEARLNSATSGTRIQRLRVSRGAWQYSKKSSGNSWSSIDSSTVYFVYQPTELRDLNGNTVSATQHAEMINAVSQGDLPITWSRSATYVYNLGRSGVSLGLDWTWKDVTDHLDDLKITNENQVWDGSRLGTHYLGSYLPNNTITAYGGKLYDSATWKIDGNKSTDEALTRFRGSFDLKNLQKESDYDYADYDYTIKSVLDDSRIYINDNMFVFVYPEGADITNENYKDYLAFWTGTSNRLGNIQYYQGKAGTLAYNNIVLGGQWGEAGADDSNNPFCKITNGWYAKPVEDGAGGIIQRELAKNPSNTEFCIDVITHDNATGGGMYRLEIKAQKKDKTPVSFYKVDADDKSKGIQGAKFTMTSANGATYFFTSGADGKTNENKLVPGTYTLKENVAGSGYLGSSNEWTVTVDANGFSIARKGTDDGNATAGTFTSGSNAGKWYITNKKDGTTPTPPTTDQDLGAPEHKKTILKTGEEDYRLSLDVKGEVGAATPIDVLLIVDRSSSMADTGSNGKTRMQIVNNAISKLVSKLKGPDVKTTINISIVGFSGTSTDYWPYTDAPYNDAEENPTLSWTNIKNVGTSNVTVDARGGTNWQAGIRRGEELLADRSGAKTYVIFLTDGKPTFRYNEGEYDQIKTGYTIGNGGDDGGNKNYNAAVNEWNKTGSKMSGAVKYVIDAGGGNKCDNLAKDVGAVGGKALKGTSATDLETAFDTIAKDITRPEYTKVSITDTLSEYADFADDVDLVVYSQEDGETTKKTLVEDTDYTVSLDRATKTVTVNLLKGEALKEKVTYTVEFNIKPTMKAYAENATLNGYGETVGQPNTDTDPEHPTSSNLPGFHSNATAKVTYTVNGKEDHAKYAHPVLQVEQDTTEHSVKKEWVGGTEESVKVKLVAKYEDAEKNQEEVPNDFQSLTADMRKEQTLTENTADTSKNWAYTWENLPKYYYYTDKDGNLAQTKIVYSVEEVNPSNKYNVTNVTSEDGKLTTITNTAKAKWEIVKVSSNSEDVKLEGAEFTLTRTTKDESGKDIIYKGVSAKETGVVSWKDAENNAVSMIPEGTYTLKETTAPGNYALSEDTWTITVGKDGSLTVTNASGNPVDCATTEETGANGNKTGVVIYSYYFKNTPMYELPSTGGIGTYWYTIGGMLMMAAALVLYRKKKYTK